MRTYSSGVDVQEDRVLLSQRGQFLRQTLDQSVDIHRWLNQSDLDVICSGRFLLELLKQTLHKEGFPY